MPRGASTVVVKISGDSSGLQKALHGAAGDVDSFGSKMERAGKKLMKVGAGLTAAVSAPILAVGAASVKAASDFGETQSKAHTVFKGIERDVDAMAKTSIDRLGLSKQSFLELLSTAGAVAQGMGMTRDESLKMADAITVLTADFASFHNLPHEQVSQKIISALTGEREGLKELGIVISEADVQKQAMLETGKKNAKQLTQEEKAAATLSLIYQRAGPAIGDYARTKDSAANRSRALKERLEELSITLGERLMPLFERALSVIEPVLEKFATLDTSTQNLVLGFGAFAVAAGPVVSAIGLLTLATKGLATAAMWLYANPVGLLIGALALLAVGLVKAYQESDEFRRVVDVLADVLQVGFATAVKGALVAAQQISNGLLLAAESALTFGAALLGWTTPAALALRDAREDIGRTRKTFNDEISAIIKKVDIFAEAHVDQALQGIADVRAQAAALTRQRYTVFIDAEGPGLVATRGVGRMRGGIPQYQHGGAVPGRGRVPAILHGGEFVLSRRMVEALRRLSARWAALQPAPAPAPAMPGRLGPPVTTGRGLRTRPQVVEYHAHFHGAVADRQQVAAWVARAFRDQRRNSGRLPF